MGSWLQLQWRWGYFAPSAKGTGGQGDAEVLLLQQQPPPAEREWGAGSAPLRDQVLEETGGRVTS